MSGTQNETLLHGSAIAVTLKNGKSVAVLLRGPSGSGKSDLALRLIDAGGQLVCDDQVRIEKHQDLLVACSVQAIAGLLEIRGVGLMRMVHISAQPLTLVVDLCAREDVPRMPEERYMTILGLQVPAVSLHAFDASTPAKIKAAAEIAVNPQLGIR